MDEPSLLFFNIDELMYRFHLYIAEPIISFFSFEWLTGGSEVGEGGVSAAGDPSFFERYFISPLYRIFSSRPSAEYDSIQEYLNPTEEKGIGEAVRGFLFGTGDKESIFTIMFTTPIGLLVLAAIFGVLYRMYLANKIEFMVNKHALLYDLANTGHVREETNNKASRWQKIIDQINSEDVNQWKIAVLDADSLLDEVLYEQGYAGEGVATKLQSAQSDNLATLKLAQEAHGVRNRIAHDAGYTLTKREAKSAIAGFERFFNELYAQ